ncbi:hypothetical protein V6N13_104589 [Hibiscus sabdariffa]
MGSSPKDKSEEGKKKDTTQKSSYLVKKIAEKKKDQLSKPKDREVAYALCKRVMMNAAWAKVMEWSFVKYVAPGIFSY